MTRVTAFIGESRLFATTSMHRCLLIPGILCTILEFTQQCNESFTEDGLEDQKLGKQTLASLAQTCRAISSPALDQLWVPSQFISVFVCLARSSSLSVLHCCDRVECSLARNIGCVSANMQYAFNFSTVLAGVFLHRFNSMSSLPSHGSLKLPFLCFLILQSSCGANRDR
ncbi:hypothetical protein HD554DRAFT_1209687 [Boletus coccyginus]|nr:hypothetical protein HD554DRAFT_1209687 [Boletus coccyginus]